MTADATIHARVGTALVRIRSTVVSRPATWAAAAPLIRTRPMTASAAIHAGIRPTFVYTGVAEGVCPPGCTGAGYGTT